MREEMQGCYSWDGIYGARSSGKITDEMVQEYLEYHKDKSNSEKVDYISAQALKKTILLF
jgi:hypothetical protein